MHAEIMLNGTRKLRITVSVARMVVWVWNRHYKADRAAGRSGWMQT